MKKLTTTKFFTIMVVSLLSVSFTSASAQSNFVARGNDQAAGSFASTSEASDPNASNAVTVSESVSKNFTKEFAGASDAVWTKNNNGFMVRFTSNGILNMAYLTKQGNAYSNIRYYTEKELPTAVRHEVKRTYYDFDITSVKEVRYNETTAYLVTVADATTWKVIRVINGESSVWEEHVKG